MIHALDERTSDTTLLNTALASWVHALEMTAPIERGRAEIFAVALDRLAVRFGAARALETEDSSLSYLALSEAVHRYSRWGVAQNLRPGDVVGLLMGNCPDYLAIWLGLSRIGVIVSLLNTHLTGDLLRHSIAIVAPRLIIVESSLAAALASARPFKAETCWAVGGGPHGLPQLDTAVMNLPSEPLSSADRPLPTLNDRALYIYTSGTTGLPKAVIVTHRRIMQWTHWFAGMMNAGPSDRMYNCLPMYHGIGGVVAIGATLVGGGSVVLRKRFSATDFWHDIVKERCTLFQYIGELCRYLLKRPANPEETEHTLRLVCGNGLRPDIWDEFKSRFRIPRILEYYASTEGSFSLYNCEGKPGAIGRIPPFLSHRLPVALVKFNEESTLPLRTESGSCIRCQTNEIGEAIGQLRDADGPTGGFDGYADAQATEQKVLRDVFVRGDRWFRSGDLMRRDAQGFFYFIDRIGDTYRWRGENVSTSEVAAVVAACRGVNDAAVYGVPVPGADGRAGMAAIVIAQEFELGAFRRELLNRLPDYARPAFIRIVPTMNVTGTFKLRSTELAAEGYDPRGISDALYVDDRALGKYVRLDEKVFHALERGVLRL
jgi:fatty-acyl-CoA synthase